MYSWLSWNVADNYIKNYFYKHGTKTAFMRQAP